ncbi:MAG: hypothetical protein Q7R31_04045 [Candidatus Levybacteria bacterium]|nr:hypothetical protein [Candidatus Levybacteria bacterium]
MAEARINGQSSEEKLLALGIPEKNIADNVVILRAVSSSEELIKEFRKRRFNCDEEQFLLPMFRPLYQRDLEVRKATLAQLIGLEIPEDVINDYFVAYGDQPYMIFRFKNKVLDDKTKDGLIEQAKQIMLNALKSHLGFSSKDTGTKP